MTHEHCEHKDCEHKNLKYCSKCKVVYCVDCGKEFSEIYSSSYTTTAFPNGTNGSGTSLSGITFTNGCQSI